MLCNIFIYLVGLSMKDKQMFETQLKPSSLHFIIKLISITVKGLKEGVYHLQLEKGQQHIKNIPQTITVMKNISEYSFDTTEQIRLKIHNTKHSSFCWSLYKKCKDNEEYIDLIKMDLSEYYKIYTDEIKKHAHQFSNIVHKKNLHKQLGTSWRNMKIMLKNCYFFTNEVCNEVNNIKIRYSLQIKHGLDYLAEKQQVKCQLMTKSSMHSSKIHLHRSSSLSSWRSKSRHISRRISFNQENLSSKSSSSREHNISSLKQTESPSLFSSSHKSMYNIQSPVYLDVQAIRNTMNQEIKDINPQLNMESPTELSEIIENSHESSTTLNMANFGDRTDRKRLAELILIQEQPLPLQKNWRRRTSVFNRPQQMNKSKNRILTLRNFKEESDLNEDKKLQVDYLSDHKLEQHSYNSRKRSLGQNLQVKEGSVQVNHQSQTMKSFVVILIILIIFLISTNAIKPVVHKINKNWKGIQRQGRYKLNRGGQKSF